MKNRSRNAEDRLPRRQTHQLPRYGSANYLVNVGREGLFTAQLKALVDRIEAASAKGRWYALHLRYVLGDGASNALVLEVLRQRLKSKKNGLCYVWAMEQSARAMRSDQTEDGIHYHVALLVNSRPNNVTRLGFMLKQLKALGYFHSYHLAAPDLKLVPLELQSEVVHAELAKACTPYGLQLTNMSAIRYAVYWLSYVTKVVTKVTAQRSFGASAIPRARPLVSKPVSIEVTKEVSKESDVLTPCVGQDLGVLTPVLKAA